MWEAQQSQNYIVSIADVLGVMIWCKYFMEAQGYTIDNASLTHYRYVYRLGIAMVSTYISLLLLLLAFLLVASLVIPLVDYHRELLHCKEYLACPPDMGVQVICIHIN